MSDIYDLYQELIIDHSKKPRNFGLLLEKTHQATGHNPLCGDHISLELCIQNEAIKDISFLGDGCAISQASASLMTEAVKGLSLEKVHEIFSSFHEMLTHENENPLLADSLGKLIVFLGVKQFPIRVKCATLAFHTLKAACDNSKKPVSTEP